MTILQAKKKVEKIVNYGVYYGQLELNDEDIEALNKLIVIADMHMTVLAYMMKGDEA